MAKSKTTTKSTSKTTNKSEGKAAVKIPRQEEVRGALKEAHAAIEQNYMSLCELLYEAYHRDYFTEWGFDEFADYCETELDIKYRKAMYLVDIWDKVKTLKLSKAKVAKLGWTKMKDIASVINEDNAKEWLEKAEKMTSREVTEAVKVTRRPDSSNGEAVPTITTMTFKMSEGEANIITDAIEEAKKLTDSNNSVVALEMICQDWLMDKGATPERTGLDDYIKYLGDLYGVTLTYKAKTKSEQSKAKKKAKEAEAKAAAKAAKEKAKAAEEEDPGDDSISDLMDEPEVAAPEGGDDDGGDDDVSIDDLIGLEG